MKANVVIVIFTLYLLQEVQQLDAHFHPNKNLHVINAKKAEKFSEGIQVSANFTDVLHSTTSTFLAVTIDSGTIHRRWKGFDFGSLKLQNMAKALSPCYFRLGGTNADFLTFDPNAHLTGPVPKDMSTYDHGLWDRRSLKELENFTMTGKQWDSITSFAEKVGWEIMFDFNIFKWKDGLWDPRNAHLLLHYSSKRGIKLPAFQLGNEPNSFEYNFNISIPGGTLVKDFSILKKLIKQFPMYNGSRLFGPDVTNLNRHSSSRNYLSDFLDAGGYNVVSEISLHHYYANGRTATLDTFMDASLMDSLKNEFILAYNATKSHPGNLAIRLTETSSCYGGGAPGLSDGYVAGFLWLDKLGLSAQHGVTSVFRQTFYGGSYALITSELEPNPDFFLSVLYKRLVEGPVFSVSVNPSTPELRVYAHCASKKSFGGDAVVFYYLNVGDKPLELSLTSFEKHLLQLYLLTPGDDDGLKSRFVKLNGRKLVMAGSELPDMSPLPHQGDVTVGPHSFGFIAVPDADVKLCSDYFKYYKAK